ncbi:MAG: L-serine ammonia-lyase, iron-sulfur-dependent, subunit alpha [Candidatus Diapherotrites archaeon]|uniref:L-serine ammonia-lyase, iron-sulfur-dependent, subunit alpha n=1 Tax=Candidatus Iainarchaeum sp. TaxID=3101447 RepID=A0A8T3YRW0_9ARCH|nr:L-serine ammonia-lyase, iron-sulfur-dependent, subunit alpha [Candidatus Diapherotrites archaeon]
MDLLERAVKERRPIHEVSLEHECSARGVSQADVRAEMLRRAGVMRGAAMKGISEAMKTRSGLVQGSAKKFFSATEGRPTLTGRIVGKAIAYSLAVAEVNASMGVIVAAPTAGSCGILPGVMLALNEEVDGSKDKLVNGLLTASGVGMFIAERATFAAAVAGCGAEIGASASMASASIVEFCGGSADEALHAAAISLKSYLGLVCDPVAGLVEVPCIKRNAIGAANAFAAADMALNGIESAIPFPQVVDAMYRIGRRLPPELRETSKGGLAATPAALRVRALLSGGEEAVQS